MATYTSNYNLLIPQKGEPIDAATFEGNLKIIDTLGSSFIFLVDFSDDENAVSDTLASKGKAVSTAMPALIII